MAAINTQKAIAALLKKGFIKDESHHHYFEFWHEGKLISRTYTSHSSKEIDEYLISAMRKQCKMDKQFFLAFIECSKSKDDYLNLLIAGNFIN